MAGAYVAKPGYGYWDDRPDGWPIWWPFPWPEDEDIKITIDWPGPTPPGYEYSYSIDISNTTNINIDGTFSSKSTVYDHSTFKTIPIADTVMQRWSASKDGVTVPIRVAGSGEFSDEVEVSFSELDGGFWGATPNLELHEGYIHDGDEIEVRVEATLGGSVVYDTATVNVKSPVITLTIGSSINPSGSVSFSVAFYVDGDPILPAMYEPGKKVILSASVNDEPVNVKLNDADSWSSSASQDWSEVGGFQVAVGDLYIEAESGDLVSVTASLEHYEEMLTDIKEVSVLDPAIVLTASTDISLGSPTYYTVTLQTDDDPALPVIPESGKKVTLSAAVDGTPVNVKLSELDEWSESVEISLLRYTSGFYRKYGYLYVNSSDGTTAIVTASIEHYGATLTDTENVYTKKIIGIDIAGTFASNCLGSKMGVYIGGTSAIRVIRNPGSDYCRATVGSVWNNDNDTVSVGGAYADAESPASTYYFEAKLPGETSSEAFDRSDYSNFSIHVEREGDINVKIDRVNENLESLSCTISTDIDSKSFNLSAINGVTTLARISVTGEITDLT